MIAAMGSLEPGWHWPRPTRTALGGLIVCALLGLVLATCGDDITHRWFPTPPDTVKIPKRTP